MTTFKRRILCSLTATLAASSIIGIPAYAAEKKELIEISFNEICEQLDCDDFFSVSSNGLMGIVKDGYIIDFISITDEDLTDWRNTGEFNFTEVEVDFDLSGYKTQYYSSKNIDKDRIGNKEYIRLDHDNGSHTFTVYDNQTQTLSKISTYDVPADNNNYTSIINADGYITAANISNGAIYISVTTPDGEQEYFFDDYNIYNGGYYIASYSLCYSGDYLAYYLVDTGTSTDGMNLIVDMYAIDKNLNKVRLYTKELSGSWFNDGDNYLVSATMKLPKDSFFIEYFVNGSKSAQYSFWNYDIQFTDSDNGNRVWSFNRDTGNEIHGTTTVIEYSSLNSVGNGYDYRYSLVDIEEGKRISDFYSSIDDFKDNDIALVETLNGKWGYIDIKGNLLASYDDASNFNGDFALVQDNGNAFLIDSDFNIISDSIKAEAIYSAYKSNIFIITNNDDNYLITYKNVETEIPTEATTEDASTPIITEEAPVIADTEETPIIIDTKEAGTPESSESIPEEKVNNNTDKSNPNTGLPFVASVPIALLAIGSAVLSHKKK